MISSKSQYAIKAMIDIALHNSELVKIKDISQRENISSKYLEQVISLLSKAKLLKWYRGNNGRYKLAKNIEEYDLYEIIIAVENDINVDFEDPTLKKFWNNYNDEIIKYFKNVKLQQLIDDYNDYNQIYDYYI